MQLTTLARVKTWSPLGAGSNVQHDGMIRGQIAAVSSRITAYLRRHVQIAQYTENYYTEMLGRRFFPIGAPIFANTTAVAQFPEGPTVTVATDPTFTYSPLRDFSVADGITPEDPLQYYLRSQDGIVEFDFPINYTGYRNPGAFQAVYYGGMAYSLDQLVTPLNAVVGVPAVGQSVSGTLSGATGTILKYTAGVTATIQVLSGMFQLGEPINDGAGNGFTWNANDVIGYPLCMAFPELVEATNMQVSWWFQNREHMGRNTVSVEGATISMEKTGTLLKGVQETIEHLVRYGTTY